MPAWHPALSRTFSALQTADCSPQHSAKPITDGTASSSSHLDRQRLTRTLHVPTQLKLTLHGFPHELALGGRLNTDIGDTYRDTPALELGAIIAAIEAGTPWRSAVAARYADSHPWLHRIVTDPSRDLFFRMHPPSRLARVLDIGAGWGQIALPLARAGCAVCALEPTPERLRFIETAARQEGLADSMWFVQADFLEANFASRFDLVACIGVLEWVPKFSPTLDPIEAQRSFLAKIRSLLAPGGTLVVGIENRLGLKYLLGAPDDHIGTPGVTTFDYTLADKKWRSKTSESLRSVVHTRAELKVLMRQAGFGQCDFHCAFPDYKLPEKIVPWGAATDAFLSSEFVIEHEGFTGTQLPFQDELRSHYRTMAKLGISSDFAPSFFVVASGTSESSHQ